MIVIIAGALVGCLLFVVPVLVNAVLVHVDETVPERGPFRALARTRLARREAGSIDVEYRELLRS